MGRAGRLYVATVTVAGVAAASALAGCSSGAERGGEREGVLEVVASFYPLQFVAERVGGEAVRVGNVTPPGAEPHDVELSAKDVAAIGDADLVVYLGGFAPAVDDAVHDVGAASLDVAGAAGLDRGATGGDDGHPVEGDQAGDHDEERPGDAARSDPHFWLDPNRLADVGDAVATRLAEARPDQATAFSERAALLRRELEALDREYRTGLAHCASTDLVTSHESFGYLAERYGFTQIGISGLSPDEDPSPAKLAEVARFVRERKVGTLYYETLVDPAVARTVARETGASTAVLDPLEGLAEDAVGDDYFSVMRANLAVLRSGQRCA